MKNQSSQAIVTAVKGSVFAISESGVKRALQLGDVVGIGETIVTEGNGTASLQTAGGELMQIIGDQVVKLTRDVIEEEIPETDTSSMESASLDAVMKAVEEGKDISEVLEATAAGGGGATSSYGNSFINLQGLVFSNDLGFSFGVSPAYIPPVTQFAWISQFGNSTPDAPPIGSATISGGWATTGTVDDEGIPVPYIVTLGGTDAAQAALIGSWIKVSVTGFSPDHDYTDSDTLKYVKTGDGSVDVYVLVTQELVDAPGGYAVFALPPDEGDHGREITATIEGLFTTETTPVTLAWSFDPLVPTSSSFTVVDDSITLTLTSVAGLLEGSTTTAEDEGTGVVYTLSSGGKDVVVSYTVGGGETQYLHVNGTGTITLPVSEADHGLTTPIIKITAVNTYDAALPNNLGAELDVTVVGIDAKALLNNTLPSYIVENDGVTLTGTFDNTGTEVDDEGTVVTYTVTATGAGVAEATGDYVKVMVNGIAHYAQIKASKGQYQP